MAELWATAERLRRAREASREFLDLWAVDEVKGKADWLDRVAADVERASVPAAMLSASERSALESGRFPDDRA